MCSIASGVETPLYVLIFVYDVLFSFLSPKAMKRRQPLWVVLPLVFLAIVLFAAVIRVQTSEMTSTLSEDITRFQPGSIDIDMAMKTVLHAPPTTLAPTMPQPVLLLFPPSATDLEKLSGPQV